MTSALTPTTVALANGAISIDNRWIVYPAEMPEWSMPPTEDLSVSACPIETVTNESVSDENAIHIYAAAVKIPAAANHVFENPNLLLTLCDFCRCMKNVVVDADGNVTRVFCDSCRAIIGAHESNACQGGNKNCVAVRFVDPVGAVAELCTVCYQVRKQLRQHSHAVRTRAKEIKLANRPKVVTPVIRNYLFGPTPQKPATVR